MADAVTRAASASVKWVTSMCVTPAYLRSALPGGQHMSSTQANFSAAANANTSSSDRSGRMADTNPSFMGNPLNAAGALERNQDLTQSRKDAERTRSGFGGSLATPPDLLSFHLSFSASLRL